MVELLTPCLCLSARLSAHCRRHPYALSRLPAKATPSTTYGLTTLWFLCVSGYCVWVVRDHSRRLKFPSEICLRRSGLPDSLVAHPERCSLSSFFMRRVIPIATGARTQLLSVGYCLRQFEDDVLISWIIACQSCGFRVRSALTDCGHPWLANITELTLKYEMVARVFLCLFSHCFACVCRDSRSTHDPF
jgi:hypothetical protein